jgi:hypothetical protein
MIWLLAILDTKWACRIICVICAALTVAQCTGRVKAERALAKSEKVAVAVKADLSTCKANTSALTASLDGQNAALAARSAEDAQRLSDAGKRLSEAVRGRESAERRAAKLLNTPPVGVDACARAMDAFETVKAEAR